MFQRWREIKMKKKLIRNKTERSKVRTELWNYFQPIHKHLGEFFVRTLKVERLRGVLNFAKEIQKDE